MLFDLSRSLHELIFPAFETSDNKEDMAVHQSKQFTGSFGQALYHLRRQNARCFQARQGTYVYDDEDSEPKPLQPGRMIHG